MADMNSCSIERTSDKHYLVRWGNFFAGQPVSVYMADNPDFFTGSPPGLGKPLLQTSEQQGIIGNPDSNIRHYFYLKPDQGEGLILAERKLQLDGSPNFRDMGGYVTIDGHRLKWGKLYRSGQLSKLSAADIAYFSTLGVSLICDFRQKIEQEQEPTKLGENKLPQFAALAITPGSSDSFLDNLHKGILDVGDTAQFMIDINRDFVINQTSQYAEMFRLLLAEDHQILIHCAAGKDRTGFGAALILDVLGVPKNVIMDDYLLTNQYLSVDREVGRIRKKFTKSTGSIIDEDLLRPMMEVRPEYLNACFDEIDLRYDSRQQFIIEALGLDEAKVETLKRRYLAEGN